MNIKHRVRELAQTVGCVLQRRPPGGEVFVLEHWDGLELYTYWSVNHQSQSADTGWQSSRIYSVDAAYVAADALAEYLNAAVVR